MQAPSAAATDSPAALPGDNAPFRRSPRRFHFVRAAFIGLAAGLLSVAFRRALAYSESGRGDLVAALHAYPAWGWCVMPVIGAVLGAFVGWLTQRFSPQAAGSGIPHLKGVLLQMREMRWRSLLPVKFFAGVIGIGAGLSLGREGPSVQMGAAVAQALARPLRTSSSDLPQLLSAGAGAGLAAAFNAPLAGLVFVVEELHRELSSRTAAGALIAAVCATVVTQWLAGDTPSFEARGLSAMPLEMLPLAAIVGILGGLGGVLFNRSLLAAQSFALRQQRVPRWLLPAIAGAIVGLVAWWMPDAIGGGQGVAEQLLNGKLALTLAPLAALLALKFVLTVISYGSGAPGGIFAPMLLIGALIGAVLAHGAGRLAPSIADQAEVLAVLGMAAMFVGSVRAPLTGIVLISEMTNGYELLFPICIAGLAAYLTGEALREPPVYDALLEADLHRSGQALNKPEPRSMYIGVQTGSPLAGRKLKDAGLPRGCLVTAVERAGVIILPAADTLLLPGDHVSILAPGDQPDAPLEIVRLCTGL